MVRTASHATRIDQFALSWLHVSGFIRCSTQDSDLAPVPAEREAKARVRLRKHGLLQVGRMPRCAFIEADLRARDAATPAPRKAAILDEARLHFLRICRR